MTKEIQVGLLDANDEEIRKVIRELEGLPTVKRTPQYMSKGVKNAAAKK